MTDESIFAAARQIADPAERAAYLDRVCTGNADLRREVESLIAADRRTGDFLAAPAAVGPGTPGWQRTPPAPPDRGGSPGTVIAGRYKLLQPIGEGGMGTVWMAEQTAPVKRLVALKLVKAGMDSGQVIARFEAERQALALMDHPNIAKVLDGGTTDAGRPFFVMELVKGQPVTTYCDAKQMSVRDRLELFTDVCAAVQHAHQKGIIHRDLKPSNVLVTEHDGTPVPKVIDFGLAKALHTPHALTEKTLYTAFGTVVGTPLYMAPEQVATNALDVDTRADIYALGVILYELLTGTTPLERKRLAEAAWDEVRRLIREEEPPRPSTRLSSSDALPSVAAQRHIEPAALSKLVRGELDWIAMRALDKDRNRRYATANAFAADVRRYLADEPVEACPPSTAYRLRKFARKHRGSLAAATTLMAVLLAAAGVSLWYADAARRSEVTAIAARNDLATVNDELEGTLARSLGRPLHFDRDLSESESEALWELAQGQARLGLRFLQEAIRTPLTTTQLRWRSEPALIAAIGLDPERRIRASRLVVERLQDQSLDYRQRADIALVGLEITSPEAGSNAAITEALWSALAKEPNEELLNTWSLQFSYRVNCVPPAFAAQILGGAFARGVAFDDDVDLFQLTEGLARVADRLSPGDAALLLADAIARPSAAQVRKVLIDNLASVTNRMSLDEAAQVCRKATRHLADALAREKDDYYRKQLALGLAQLARRLPSVEATELLTDSLAKESNVYARFTLAESLIQFADQMSSEEAGQVRGRFFRLLADALTKENDAHVRKFLAELLARHAGQLPPQQAARQCSDTARLLADALDKATDPSVRLYLAEGLSHVTTKLPPDAAAKVCSDSARLLADTLTKETERNPWSLHLTTAGLALLAARLPQDEADRICGDAARFLAGALVKQTHASNRRRLVHAMKHLTARMSGNDAVLLLTDTLTKENDPYTLRLLVEGLVTNTGRHTASEVERLCSEVAAKSWDKNSWFERELAIGSLLTQVSLTDAQPRARYHAFRVAADERANSFDPTDQSTTGVTALDRLLTATSPTTVKQRSAAAMVAISQGAAGPLAVLPALPTAAEPPPCRLTTQELVDLLKMPTLYGEARKVVLKHLGNRYGRRFPDHWAFVRYATEQKLGLDFTTPPKRPPAVQ